ncbi:MAG: WG repeat-containing protein [Bacteroidetes bacterium]|nr:WG repeat-containing protein [Bacteroidota bacterium]
MTNGLTKFALTITVLIFVNQTQGQTIEVGQSAEQIKGLIEWTTKDHNKPDTYGNKSSSYWTWDVKYNNGQITDVVQCYQKQYLLDLRTTADYCKHYIMDKSKLAYVLTQFENISVEKITENYNTNSMNKKIGGLYFSENYEYYSKIYLSTNGLATVEWRKTVVSELPASIQSSVSSKLTTIRTETKNKQTEELNTQLIQEDADTKERKNTILSCENFSNGLALFCYDTEHKAGEMNYSYGKKLYGYINEKGEVLISPKYEEAFSFNNGFALVTTNSRYSSNWEFINTKGENVFNKKFAAAKSFVDGFAAVRIVKGDYGFIDKTGNFISKPQYKEIGDFKEGFARVKFQDKWGYIDSTGKEIIYPQFSNARDFSEGLAMVSQFVDYSFTQYSYIDQTGKVVIKLGERDAPVLSSGISNYGMSKDKKLEFAFCDFHNGMAMIGIDRTQGYIGFSGTVFIDKAGKTVIKPKDSYQSIYHYNEGFALAQKYGVYGFLNDKGKWAITPIFEDAGNFHEGLAKVKLNDNWGFVDATGNVVINKDILKSKTEIILNPPYDAVSDFSDGFAVVQVRQKYGYIDKSGNWIIKPELTLAKPFKNGIARVKFADRKGWNYIDKNGKILFTNFL